MDMNLILLLTMGLLASAILMGLANAVTVAVARRRIRQIRR
ncbi:MAG: hypothetical protein AB7P24_14350 [Nitrospira sp.]